MRGVDGASDESDAPKTPDDGSIMDTLIIIEYRLCKEFNGFNLYNIDETDVDSLIPFILYALVDKGKGAGHHNTPDEGEYIVINGKKYKKAAGNKFSK